MIWGAWSLSGLRDKIAVVKADAGAGLVYRLLGFNEPDSPKQADMTVQKAIEFWPELESANLPLASPAATDPLGPWMMEFMNLVEQRSLRVDYISVHWYGGVSPTLFQNKMKEVHAAYGRPLFLTEFAPADWTTSTSFTRQQVLDFAKVVLPWLEAQTWIEGYAWFPFAADSPYGASSALFESNNSLTPLGRYYKSVRRDNPSGNQAITA
jgi:hypothetical protein